MENERTENKLKLLEKLHKIDCAFDYLKKDKTAGKKGSSYSYDYVSGPKVLAVFKEQKKLHKVLLEPRIGDIKSFEHTEEVKEFYDSYSKKLQKKHVVSNVILVTGFYVWIDTETGEERTVPWLWTAEHDDAAKVLGSAMTYGEKRFLFKYFNIPMDDLDPDGFKQKNTVAGIVDLNDSKYISALNLAAVRNYINLLGKSENTVIATINEKLKLSIKKLEQIPKEHESHVVAVMSKLVQEKLAKQMTGKDKE